jgi:hypothetical protein
MISANPQPTRKHFILRYTSFLGALAEGSAGTGQGR